MDKQPNTGGTERDFTSVSPSAKALLLMKGLTGIPFARQAAELMMAPEKYVPDYTSKNFALWARTVHFEVRYASIDQLLVGLPIKNILELSSGFSFRGLNSVINNDVHYIDTDLPDLIKQKKGFVDALKKNIEALKGTLETMPLNAIDEQQFDEVVSHFPEGALAIVNEGLLMYLDMEEKTKLCGIIHKILKQRGGYWITADVYIKTPPHAPTLQITDELQQFLDDHNVEENKFDSFESAEQFFNKNGFIVDKEAEQDYSKVESIKYLLQSVTEEQLKELQKTRKIHATWRLKAG